MALSLLLSGSIFILVSKVGELEKGQSLAKLGQCLK